MKKIQVTLLLGLLLFALSGCNSNQNDNSNPNDSSVSGDVTPGTGETDLNATPTPVPRLRLRRVIMSASAWTADFMRKLNRFLLAATWTVLRFTIRWTAALRTRHPTYIQRNL